MDPLRDLQYIQMGNIGQGVPALKGGAIDALTTNPPDDLIAQKLGFKVILDITAMKIPFAATVLASSRNTIVRKQPELTRFMHAYAEAIHYFLTNREGTAQVVSKYTKVTDKEVLNYAIETDSKAVQKTLEVGPKGIELILELISKTVPQAASAKSEDFYDSRFTAELKDSGLIKRLWGEN
jgi:ABC-type nitrate/sulfonate/bicarbonate transport system substrate-binding protein